MGICKDEVIENYVLAMAGSASRDERRAAVREIADLALSSGDLAVVARALKALKSLLPLDPGTENALDKKLLALIDQGEAEKNEELAGAIALFVYCRSQSCASVARPYMQTLLSFLTHDVSTTGAYSYYTLMIVARETPRYFEPWTDTLVLMLNSPGYAAKVFAMRIIAALTPCHPEYVVDARDILFTLSETDPQEIIRAEAAKAYAAVKTIPKVRRDRSRSLPDDPEITSLYEKPVWQHAVKDHLSAAYEGEAANISRLYRRRSGARRNARPSKRCDLYQEFVEKLKTDERALSFEDQLALLSPEAIAAAASCGTGPAEDDAPVPAPSSDISFSVINELMAATPPADESPADLAATINLQEMMNEVQNEFSSKAGGLLEALGMGHLNRAGSSKAGDGNRKFDAKEFVSALEKMVREHKSKAM